MQFVDDNIDVEPIKSANGRVVLRAGKRSRVLVKNDELTAAGRRYEEKRWKDAGGRPTRSI